MAIQTIRFCGKLGPTCWAEINAPRTLCGKPMLSRNYNKIRGEQENCSACLKVMSDNRARYGIAPSQPKPGDKPRWQVKVKITLDFKVEVEADTYDQAMEAASEELTESEGWTKRKIAEAVNVDRFEAEPIDAERI